MSLGSNGVDRVRSLQKFRCEFVSRTSTLIIPVQIVLNRVSYSNETLPNAPKHYETHQYMSLGLNGWSGGVPCEKLWCDFMARTCVLIVPVQPILLHVSGSNETLPNAPKHFETHKNRSLGSDWVDQVRSLRKIPMRLHAMNLWINSPISAHFAPCFVL